MRTWHAVYVVHELKCWRGSCSGVATQYTQHLVSGAACAPGVLYECSNGEPYCSHCCQLYNDAVSLSPWHDVCIAGPFVR